MDPTLVSLEFAVGDITEIRPMFLPLSVYFQLDNYMSTKLCLSSVALLWLAVACSRFRTLMSILLFSSDWWAFHFFQTKKSLLFSARAHFRTIFYSHECKIAIDKSSFSALLQAENGRVCP